MARGQLEDLDVDLLPREDDLDAVFMAMGEIAAIIMGGVEEDDDNGVAWHSVEINMADFDNMGDPSFKLHFRMTRVTFELLVQVFGNHPVQTNRLNRERTPVPHILMMVLWILATPDSFRSVALQFGVRPGTVHYHYLYILEVLVELAPRFIIWPTAEERQEMKQYFEEMTGFPRVIGCIDGTHHDITAPRFDKPRYVNRHDKYSVNTQVVCDHRLLIRDIKVGEVGSKHDSRILRESPLCARLLEDPNAIGFDEHILGDGGYFLANFIIAPFRNNGHLRPRQVNFNPLHAQVRNRIENCHCRSKGLWRRTKFLHAMHQEVVVNHILSSACLHNFVILNGEEIEGFVSSNFSVHLFYLWVRFSMLIHVAQAEHLREPIQDEELEDDVDEQLVDDDPDDDVDYPNVPIAPDHPLLEESRELGVEKRLHLMGVNPRLYA